MSFVGQAKGKGRFRTLLSVQSNFATLNLSTGVMQQSVCVGVLYPNDSLLLLEGVTASCIYNTTRRGLACVAYPYLGAMRRPDCRDKREGTNSHVFFCFQT